VGATGNRICGSRLVEVTEIEVGTMYRARRQPGSRAYRYVVLDRLDENRFRVVRGWYEYAVGRQPSPDDPWVHGRTVDVQVPPFIFEEALGSDPGRGAFRRDDPAGVPASGNHPTSTEWSIPLGKLVRRVELHAAYGGSGRGGISSSRTTPNILVFTDLASGRQHGYMDEWDGAVLHYFGEGQRGDQALTKGNKAIAQHRETGKALRLFEGSEGSVGARRGKGTSEGCGGNCPEARRLGLSTCRSGRPHRGPSCGLHVQRVARLRDQIGHVGNLLGREFDTGVKTPIPD
jgi:hypothetical protein